MFFIGIWNCVVTEEYFENASALHKLSAEYIIAKSLAYSIQDDNRKIPIDCSKYHVKHDVTILLT